MRAPAACVAAMVADLHALPSGPAPRPIANWQEAAVDVRIACGTTEAELRFRGVEETDRVDVRRNGHTLALDLPPHTSGPHAEVASPPDR